MAKQFACADVGLDCSFTAQAETEEALMEKVAKHAAEVHDMTEIDDETMAQIKAQVQDV